MKTFKYIISGIVIVGAILYGQKNTQAITAALSKDSKTVNASWFGFNKDDSTEAMQSAIRSGAKKVIVDNVGEWIVMPIILAGDQEIVFDVNTRVTAKRGEYKGGGDSLFTGKGIKNSIVTGRKGSVLRMWKSDYQKPPYQLAEWRHSLAFFDSESVTITGLTLRESGGDGIYLNKVKNTVIRDVVCDAHHRQGISVISVENLLIENCIFKNTSGTAPQSGIDFEPNGKNEKLVNVRVRDCRSENNQGMGFQTYLGPFTKESKPFDLTFENCVSIGNKAPGYWFGLSPELPAGNKISLINCRSENEIPFKIIQYHETTELTGTITGIQEGITTNIDLSKVPYDQVAAYSSDPESDLVNSLAITGKPLVPMKTGDIESETVRNLLMIRGPGTYVCYAERSEEVILSAELRKLGTGYGLTELQPDITAPSGKKVTVEPITFGKSEIVFTAPEKGAYILKFDPKVNAMVLGSKTTPIGLISLDSKPFWFLSATGKLFFYVPQTVGLFAVEVLSAQPGEKVKATLFDADENKIDGMDNIDKPYRLFCKRKPGKPAIYSVLFEKPTDGSNLDDFNVCLLGVPQIFAASPETLIIPQETTETERTPDTKKKSKK